MKFTSLRQSCLALALATGIPFAIVAQAPWQVGPTPSAQIPALTPSGEVRFNLISAATQLASGELVVADGGASSLVFLTPAGVVTRRVGRPGAGPGEFQSLWWMGRCGGDTLVVHDLAGRISYFSPVGEFQRQLPMTDPVGLMRCGSSGRLVMLALDGPGMPAEGSFRPTTRLMTVKDRETPRVVRAGVPATEIAIANTMPVPDPLGRVTVLGVLGDEILVGTGDSTRLDRLTADGKSAGLIRWSTPRIRPTPQDREAASRALLATAPAPIQKDLGQQIARLPLPAWLPPYFGLWVPASNEIWLLTSVPGATPTRFLVLTPSGAIRATAAVPRALTVLDITATSVVASAEGDDGELSLLVLPIDRQLVQAPSPSSVTVVSGSTADGKATPLWLAVLRRRLTAAAFDSVAPIVRQTEDAEKAWADLIRARAVEWPKELARLVLPFPGLEPRPIQVVLGNRGAEDAFSHDSLVIGLDLSALVRTYGSSSLPENADRLDRFFRHEASHTLQKRWLNLHPFAARQPIDLALLDIWLEGLGNYYSLSPRWSSNSDLRQRTLAQLEPRFVARMAALACADSVTAKPLLADLSSGPFDQKWGALPTALWLQREQQSDSTALRRFVVAGPEGVWQLAGRNLPPALADSLSLAKRRAAARGRLRDPAPAGSLLCGR